MKWEGDRESENVEDRRGGLGKPAMIAGGGLGTIVLIVLALLFHQDPRAVLQQAGGPAAGQVSGGGGPPVNESPEEKRKVEFVRVVLADTEDVWRDQFQQMGRQYLDPKLVLFRDQVQSQCGMASSASGPFYCPPDRNVYIDLAFYDELKNKLGAPGDFAQAYVIAHEVGHHVQNLMGISDKVHAAEQRGGKVEANKLSVRLELQADFLAGVWAHHIQKKKKILEPGDIDSALNAAAAIGDDRLQKQARGYVVPDSFTHGTSRQRVGWFKKGFETGDFNQGDTFNLPDP